MAKGQKITVDKKKAGYQAIAVVVAIDKRGEVVALLTNPGSIKKEEFIAFIRQIHRRYKG